MQTFATTHWCVVLAAGQSGQPQAESALADLFRIYWYPIFAYVRGRGYQPADAEDLTQGFFLHLLERDSVARADRHKGRFRSFLLGALNHYLADAQDQAKTQKRGGGCPILSIDAVAVEERYRLEPVERWSPDRLFDRQWALALLDHVFGRLQEAEIEAGRGAAFERLRHYAVLTGGDQPFAEAARDLGMSEEAVKKAVQRLRGRYQQLFREEIGQTVADAAEAEAEIRYLCELMAG